jgi:hypothetical protein
MTRPQLSDTPGRRSARVPEDAAERRIALDLCAKLASVILVAPFAVLPTLLAVGCAEEVESEPEQAVEPRTEIRTARQIAPRKDPPLDGPEFRLQRKRDWWNDTRESLFTDIDLSAEQVQAVDAILETQLNARARVQQLDKQFTAARKTQNQKRIKAAREEFRAFKTQLKEPHEIYEEMRLVLTEEQRPAFDMNRARHVAAMQGSGRTRPE